jgi:CxxC-x17-CxxC domain-containing protein
MYPSRNSRAPKSFSRERARPGRFDRPMSDGPREMFSAQCSSCGNQCEVPFRPNGKKPVFCSNCFKRDEDRGDSRDFRDSRDSRSFRSAGLSSDHRGEDLKRQFMTLDSKMDRILQLLEAKRPKKKADGGEA